MFILIVSGIDFHYSSEIEMVDTHFQGLSRVEGFRHTDNEMLDEGGAHQSVLRRIYKGTFEQNKKFQELLIHCISLRCFRFYKEQIDKDPGLRPLDDDKSFYMKRHIGPGGPSSLVLTSSQEFSRLCGCITRKRQVVRYARYVRYTEQSYCPDTYYQAYAENSQ